MKAVIKQVDRCAFIGKSDSNHWTAIDVKKESCGTDAATSPMEMVLLALGSCSGADVVSILEKKKVALDGFEINIDAERAESFPKVFTKIHLEYVVYGKDIDRLHVERAVALSLEKYCSVHAMIKDAVTITSSVKVVG